MNLWPCFICGRESLCEHRELELMIWVRQVESDQQEYERRRYLEGLRMPVASETGWPEKRKHVCCVGENAE